MAIQGEGLCAVTLFDDSYIYFKYFFLNPVNTTAVASTDNLQSSELHNYLQIVIAKTIVHFMRCSLKKSGDRL
jgi:hypothetical protein